MPLMPHISRAQALLREIDTTPYCFEKLSKDYHIGGLYQAVRHEDRKTQERNARICIPKPPLFRPHPSTDHHQTSPFDCVPRPHLPLGHPRFVQALPQDIRIGLGATLTLPVHVSGRPACIVRWYKNDRLLQPRTHPNVQIRHISKDVYVMFIAVTVQSDSGVYMCRAYNADGEACSSTAVIVEPWTLM